jgi:beta-RFAP synthase
MPLNLSDRASSNLDLCLLQRDNPGSAVSCQFEIKGLKDEALKPVKAAAHPHHKQPIDSELVSVEVETLSAARLHFGFLDVSGSLGRMFGSIGLSISNPGMRIRARFADEISIRGRDADAVNSAMKYAKMFYGHPEIRGIAEDLPRAVIFLDETIPFHCGFGAGTQLALCVASSLCRLHGLDRSPALLALMTGRGKRSGIGIESFGRGGFIVDAGAPTGGAPLTLFRADFPPNWRVVTILPPNVGKGLNGGDEHRAFESMPAPDSGRSREICHIVMMKLLPALLEKKLGPFGDALGRIQEITGESFAPFQSGSPFASPMAQDIFKKMGSLGATGMGQSSWGPVLYGFVDGPDHAISLASGLWEYFSGSDALKGADLAINVVSGRNRGAVTRELKI